MSEEVPQAKGFQVDYGAPYEEVVVKTAAFCDAVDGVHFISLLRDDFDNPLEVMRQCAEYFQSPHRQGREWRDIWSCCMPQFETITSRRPKREVGRDSVLFVLDNLDQRDCSCLSLLLIKAKRGEVQQQ